MAARIMMQVTARRKWWLRIMLPTLVVVARCAAVVVCRLPARMRPQIDSDRASEILTTIVRRGLVVKVQAVPVPASSSSH